MARPCGAAKRGFERTAGNERGWLEREYAAYVVVEDGAPVAYCLFRDDGDHYYMRQLYVERGHRRRGIATRFLDWMYANVWADKKVRLDVLADNARAIAFYEAYGFQVRCLNMER